MTTTLELPTLETVTVTEPEPASSAGVWYALDAWIHWDVLRSLTELRTRLESLDGSDHAQIITPGQAPGSPWAQVIGSAPDQIIVELSRHGWEMPVVATTGAGGPVIRLPLMAVEAGYVPIRTAYLMTVAAAADIVWDWMRTGTTTSDTEPAIDGPHRRH